MASRSHSASRSELSSSSLPSSPYEAKSAVDEADADERSSESNSNSAESMPTHLASTAHASEPQLPAVSSMTSSSSIASVESNVIDSLQEIPVLDTKSKKDTKNAKDNKKGVKFLGRFFSSKSGKKAPKHTGSVTAGSEKGEGPTHSMPPLPQPVNSEKLALSHGLSISNAPTRSVEQASETSSSSQELPAEQFDDDHPEILTKPTGEAFQGEPVRVGHMLVPDDDGSGYRGPQFEAPSTNVEQRPSDSHMLSHIDAHHPQADHRIPQGHDMGNSGHLAHGGHQMHHMGNVSQGHHVEHDAHLAHGGHMAHDGSYLAHGGHHLGYVHHGDNLDRGGYHMGNGAVEDNHGGHHIVGNEHLEHDGHHGHGGCHLGPDEHHGHHYGGSFDPAQLIRDAMAERERERDNNEPLDGEESEEQASGNDGNEHHGDEYEGSNEKGGERRSTEGGSGQGTQESGVGGSGGGDDDSSKRPPADDFTSSRSDKEETVGDVEDENAPAVFIPEIVEAELGPGQLPLKEKPVDVDAEVKEEMEKVLADIHNDVSVPERTSKSRRRRKSSHKKSRQKGEKRAAKDEIDASVIREPHKRRRSSKKSSTREKESRIEKSEGEALNVTGVAEPSEQEKRPVAVNRKALRKKDSVKKDNLKKTKAAKQNKKPSFFSSFAFWKKKPKTASQSPSEAAMEPKSVQVVENKQNDGAPDVGASSSSKAKTPRLAPSSSSSSTTIAKEEDRSLKDVFEASQMKPSKSASRGLSGSKAGSESSSENIVKQLTDPAPVGVRVMEPTQQASLAVTTPDALGLSSSSSSESGKEAKLEADELKVSKGGEDNPELVTERTVTTTLVALDDLKREPQTRRTPITRDFSFAVTLPELDQRLGKKPLPVAPGRTPITRATSTQFRGGTLAPRTVQSSANRKTADMQPRSQRFSAQIGDLGVKRPAATTTSSTPLPKSNSLVRVPSSHLRAEKSRAAISPRTPSHQIGKDTEKGKENVVSPPVGRMIIPMRKRGRDQSGAADTNSTTSPRETEALASLMKPKGVVTSTLEVISLNDTKPSGVDTLKWVPKATDVPDNVALSENWVVEDPKKKVNWFDLFNPRHLKIIETNALNDYEQHFESKSHQNYMCNHPTKGPFIFSITEVKETIEVDVPITKAGLSTLSKKPKEAPRTGYRCLLRTREGDRRFFLETKTFPKSTKSLKTAVFEHESWFKASKIKRIKAPLHQHRLLQLEQKFAQNAIKVGVIYAKAGQKKESEMLSNTKGSTEFNDFLGFMGDFVRLKGWKKYAGGLDTENSLTGSHSIYTTFEDIEVMFHVSTLLPSNADDPQCISKKLHIGNDVIVIIWLDSLNAKFKPEFNHVYIIIQPAETTDKTRVFLRVTVCTKYGVDTADPKFPPGTVFERNSMFRSLLLAKIINSEKLAYQSEGFSAMTENIRFQNLHNLFQEYYLGKPTMQAPIQRAQGSSANMTTTSLSRKFTRTGYV